VVTDNAVGALMGRGLVDAVITGSDRVAANGDVANKIGTYTVAVMAHRHGVPFYAALPTSTIDPDVPSGDAIPIEERDPSEVTTVSGTRIVPANATAVNYAFDVTPHELVNAIITEAGVLRAPFESAIGAALASDGAVHGAAA
jgi:methylthioribose-1-phosphate isomerase